MRGRSRESALLNPDFRDILSIFNEENVEFLVIGAYELAAYAINAAFLVFLRRFFSAYSAFFAYPCESATENSPQRRGEREDNSNPVTPPIRKPRSSLRLCGEFSLVAAQPRYAIRPQFLGFVRRFFSAPSACFSKQSYAASLFSCSSVIRCAARTAEMTSRPREVST